MNRSRKEAALHSLFRKHLGPEVGPSVCTQLLAALGPDRLSRLIVSMQQNRSKSI